MANMSYCRFRNTADDVVDCLRAVDEMDSEAYADLSKSERFALWDLMAFAKELLEHEAELLRIDADHYEAEIEDDLEQLQK